MRTYRQRKVNTTPLTSLLTTKQYETRTAALTIVANSMMNFDEAYMKR